MKRNPSILRTRAALLSRSGLSARAEQWRTCARAPEGAVGGSYPGAIASRDMVGPSDRHAQHVFFLLACEEGTP